MENIEWKEAKGGQTNDESDQEGDWQESDEYHEESSGDEDHQHVDQGQVTQSLNDPSVDINPSHTSISTSSGSDPVSRRFLHSHINLKLRRNIVALADPNQHIAKPDYGLTPNTKTLEQWIDSAIVAISPDADVILMANHTPEKEIFVAKLRKEPINQYTTKPLEVPLDYDETVTSLLCLPSMSTQKTAYGLVDWTTMVVGLSSGYIKFYTEHSICLLSFKFANEPVQAIKCQTQKVNLNARSEPHFANINDELLILYGNSAVIIDGLSLYENVRIAKDEVVKQGLSYEPAYNLTNLPTVLHCQKWNLNVPSDAIVSDAEIFGTRFIPSFDSLRSASIDSDFRSTKVFSRTLAIAGRNPFISFHHESKESTTHSYTEMIGSLFNIWNKQQPTNVQSDDISVANNLSLFDKSRHATSIVSSPDRRLAAITDDFGRVLLIDVTDGLIVRMWKGYRSAQCGWIEVKRNPEIRDSPYATFLVIYAPKRGLLEIWSAQRGPRVAAFDVGKSCRLLYSGYKMFNSRDVQQKGLVSGNITEQSYSSQCYLLNARSETVFSIELPYTYSLYKYGDLKSRDYLLMIELNNAIKQDSEVAIISDVLHRIALAESLEISINKIIMNLAPQKIVAILENLIIKIMKNYDTHAGETMSAQDTSILELCKRIIRLCAMYIDLTISQPRELSLPDVNQRLIEEYEEHPQEIDNFAESLGWSTSEILRYLSLLALERSYRKSHQSNPWPSIGEPLTWNEFISCFYLERVRIRQRDSGTGTNYPIQTDKLSIKLLDLNSKFLLEDKVIKTSIFMYNRVSEKFYRSLSHSKQDMEVSENTNNFNYIDPSSRLALMFQFWLSTRLCFHWKMWAFLQDRIGQISDELKVDLMTEASVDADKILIDIWKQIYNLILESDNVFAAITATCVIRSDILRMIRDDERREKLSKEDTEESRPEVDWECLCIDAERMSLLSQQLEDVFLLNLLLKYSTKEGCLVERYFYRTPRVSVANVIRGGPTIVSELVAQWAVQSGVDLKIFLDPYLGGGEGESCKTDEETVLISGSLEEEQKKPLPIRSKRLSGSSTNLEHAKELLHHTKTAFPCSLDANVVLIYCTWELCRQWANNSCHADKSQLLRRALECIRLIGRVVGLRHKLATVVYKTFFQHTFVRLVVLVETNSTMANLRNSRLCDSLTRKELNMSEDCLEEFVRFTCNLSEFMLETRNDVNDKTDLDTSLLQLDNWWSTPAANALVANHTTTDSASATFHSNLDNISGEPHDTTTPATVIRGGDSSANLVRIVFHTNSLFDLNTLIDLNRLACLMKLIFTLKVARSYPISLIGEESRQTLQLDLQQSPSAGGPSGLAATDLKNRFGSGSLAEWRHKFARKCIQNIVHKIDEESDAFGSDCDEAIQADELCRSAKPTDLSARLPKRDDRDSSSKSELSIDHNRQDCSGSKSKAKAVSRSSRDSVEQTRASEGGAGHGDFDDDDDNDDASHDISQNDSTQFGSEENNESMLLFANLLSIANEWQLDCDELYLELIFELFRCNHDKIGSPLLTRVKDQALLASGLLKICSQRVLVLFGLSPQVSGPEWRRRADIWSLFAPNVASWLRSIQQEEMRREIASLSFSPCHFENNSTDVQQGTTTRATKSDQSNSSLHGFVLHALKRRSELALENATNHLQGPQAPRLAYDLLQLLKSSKVADGRSSIELESELR